MKKISKTKPIIKKCIDRPADLEMVSADHPFKQYCHDFIKNNFGKISDREMARQLKVGKTTVNNWAKLHDLFHIKHTVNEEFFNRWASDMAYIFGFICADGNIAWDEVKSYYTMTITSAQKDKDHLEKIRAVLESTKPLLYAQSTKSYRLIVNSKSICRRLMNMGVVPRKSLILKWPNVPDQYLKDFIRGYVDGDGSLRYFNRKRSPYFELMVCSGSPDFIVALKQIIFQQVGVESKITKTKNECYVLRYSCNRGMKLAEWLYYNSYFYLARKFNKYMLALCPRKD